MRDMKIEEIKEKILKELNERNDIKQITKLEMFIRVPVKYFENCKNVTLDIEVYAEFIDKYLDEKDEDYLTLKETIPMNNLIVRLKNLPDNINIENIEIKTAKNGNQYYKLKINNKYLNLFSENEELIELIKKAFDIQYDRKYKTIKYIIFKIPLI